MNQKAMDFYASNNWEACYRCLPQMAQKILFLLKDGTKASHEIYQELFEPSTTSSGYLSRLARCGLVHCAGLKYSIVNEDFAAYISVLREVPPTPDEAAKYAHDQVFKTFECLLIRFVNQGLMTGSRQEHAEKVAQYAAEVVLENWKDA